MPRRKKVHERERNGQCWSLPVMGRLTIGRLESVFSAKMLAPLSVPRLYLVRDLFLFYCYAGISYGDMCRLTTANLETSEDGTHITLSLGVPIETVSRMMGHRRLMTTQIYAHVTDRKVDEDTKQLRKLSASRKLGLYEEPQNKNNRL